MSSPFLLDSYRLTRELNAQWQRLCDGKESAPDVAAALDRWRRSPAADLGEVAGLADVLGAVRRCPDLALGQLVFQAQRGDAVASRVVLQAMLPKLVLLARSQQRARIPFEEVLAGAVAALWERVATYPLLSRPQKVAANLALDTLKALRAGQVEDARSVPVPDLEGHQEAVETPLDDELGLVLTRAVDLGVITSEEARLLVLVYRHDQPDVAAAELGISPGAVRRRCHSVKARLRPAAFHLTSIGFRVDPAGHAGPVLVAY